MKYNVRSLDEWCIAQTLRGTSPKSLPNRHALDLSHISKGTDFSLLLTEEEQLHESL